ncbi:hypothetical protein [Paraburkholderia humisilvae]|uniref:Type III secretion protein HrpB7 n=1 Tax=Paraburkholderia humisilvae TaxID=627669 RepID=A0A6J5ECY0_9BURK|nr:hypothetical protein [Paraburkholderia humisilvae]CAB3764329.1 hypothetical protein LMG29542_04862 [Paraburkholderia humisilvae]
MTDRRLHALRLSRQRRERLDTSLRRVLDGQRGEYAAQRTRTDACANAVAVEAAALQAHHARMEAMVCGSEAFSLEAFNMCRQYIETLAERHRACLAQLEQQQQALDACAQAIAQTQRKISANHVRQDLLGKRSTRIAQELDAGAQDAADDEALEAAVARLTRQRGIA